MQVLKTPESAFDKIPDFPYVPRYVAVTDTISSEITMAYYQCGPADGHTILLMHGEPTWAYLYPSTRCVPGYGARDSPT